MAWLLSLFVPKIQSTPFNLTKFTKQNHPLYNLPFELINRCLFQSDFRTILNFSQVNKEGYIITTTPAFWSSVAAIFNLKATLPNMKEAVCFAILTEELNLKQNLGKEICQKIDAMPFWTKKFRPETILHECPYQIEDDKMPHFFKAFFDGDLYLILIAANRKESRVICFNGHFNVNKRQDLGLKKEYICKQYFLTHTTGYFVETSAFPLMERQYQYQSAWLAITNKLEIILDISP